MSPPELRLNLPRRLQRASTVISVSTASPYRKLDDPAEVGIGSSSPLIVIRPARLVYLRQRKVLAMLRQFIPQIACLPITRPASALARRIYSNRTSRRNGARAGPDQGVPHVPRRTAAR